MSSDGLALPPAIERLYVVVKDGKPKKISVLFAAVYEPGSVRANMTTRDMQQHIGGAVTNLNRRIRKQKKILKPAEIKGTYALVAI
jgi:ribosome-associated translation inhibitor RaiA